MYMNKRRTKRNKKLAGNTPATTHHHPERGEVEVETRRIFVLLSQSSFLFSSPSTTTNTDINSIVEKKFVEHLLSHFLKIHIRTKQNPNHTWMQLKKRIILSSSFKTILCATLFQLFFPYYYYKIVKKRKEILQKTCYRIMLKFLLFTLVDYLTKIGMLTQALRRSLPSF